MTASRQAPPPFVVAFVVGVTPGKWARTWQERRPWHPLTLAPLSQVDALAALADGSAQVALVRLPVDQDDLARIALYEETAVAVAPKDHPLAEFDAVTVGDLAGETLLATPDEASWSDAIALVAANVGVAVMPQSVARAHSRRDVVARLLPDAPTTRIALAWPEAAMNDDIEEFIGIVRGRTANSSRGIQPAEEPAPKKPAKPARSPKPKTGRTAQPRRRR